MNQELISVIIPIYNVEKYLDYCVESVVNQSYKNIEIILVDDGSPDSCPKICDNWAKRDSRIIVIHKSNGGLSDARNAGLDIAKGDYIYFLDSDDFISLDAIEKLHTALTKTGSDMAVGNNIHINEKKEAIRFPTFKTDSYTLEGIDKFVGINKNLQIITAWNKLCKKEIFKDIRFPFGKLNEDQFTAHIIADKCNKIALLDVVTYYYLCRNDSIMTKPYTVNRLDALEGVLNRVNLYLEKGFFNLVSFPMNIVFDRLVKAYSLLDLREKENYNRIKELRVEFKRLYKIANKNNCFGKKDSIKLYIFTLSPKLHSLTMRNYSRLIKLVRFTKKIRKSYGR